MPLVYVEISSNYTKKRNDLFDRERLALRKSTRNHKKRHSVNKERSYLDREKSKARKLKEESNYSQHSKYLQAVRDYWRGITECHPV